MLPQTLVCLDTDSVDVDGQHIQSEEQKFYYVLNKPHGYICSNAPLGSKKRVLDLFAGHPCRLFTVGRLDRDTTGLLLITNDGHFANQVIHPSSNLSKEYVIKTVQEISDTHLKAISQGTLIEGVHIRPFRVVKVRKGTLKITVKEGKKREVRLLVQNAGLQILELSRIRIGSLLLGSLPEGMYREMSATDRELLFK